MDSKHYMLLRPHHTFRINVSLSQVQSHHYYFCYLFSSETNIIADTKTGSTTSVGYLMGYTLYRCLLQTC